MNYVVFDLEATCTDDPRLKNSFKNEIIEIGAVKFNEKLEPVSEFQTFIKPKLNPQLTDFCKQLTSIEQKNVDNSRLFFDAISPFINWCSDDNNTPFWLCSWGNYDRNQFEKDCKLHGINYEWIYNHISIKHQYMELTGKGPRDAGMAKVLRDLKLKLEGTHHRGIDDARNIGKIFVKLFPQLKFERW